MSERLRIQLNNLHRSIEDADINKISYSTIENIYENIVNILKKAFIDTINNDKTKRSIPPEKIDKKFAKYRHINCDEYKQFKAGKLSYMDLCNVWYRDIVKGTAMADEPASQYYHIVKKLIGDISLPYYDWRFYEELNENLQETSWLIKDLVLDISDAISNIKSTDWDKEKYGKRAIEELEEIRSLIDNIVWFYSQEEERPQSSKVLEIRNKTGVGIMDVKKVLAKCNGDVEMTVKIIKEMLDDGRLQTMWKQTWQSHEDK